MRFGRFEPNFFYWLIWIWRKNLRASEMHKHLFTVNNIPSVYRFWTEKIMWKHRGSNPQKTKCSVLLAGALPLSYGVWCKNIYGKNYLCIVYIKFKKKSRWQHCTQSKNITRRTTAILNTSFKVSVGSCIGPLFKSILPWASGRGKIGFIFVIRLFPRVVMSPCDPLSKIWCVVELHTKRGFQKWA